VIFPFFSSKKTPLPTLEVDLHSHLIPAIDDGAKTLDESLTLIQSMVDLGYKKLITTPHIMADTYRNTPQSIAEGLYVLKEALRKKKIEVEIEVAAEYYLDDGFLGLLHQKEILTIQNQYLLFETSYTSKPLQLEEMIFEMTSLGYRPIMAHPERYRYIKNPQKEYRRLKDLGVYFQVNLNSFGGYYGKSSKVLAQIVMELGMIDFLGSDVHHLKQVSSLAKISQLSLYPKIFQHNRILNHTLI
jgi:tyrosine-protein phosphatase YwqE